MKMWIECVRSLFRKPGSPRNDSVAGVSFCGILQPRPDSLGTILLTEGYLHKLGAREHVSDAAPCVIKCGVAIEALLDAVWRR